MTATVPEHMRQRGSDPDLLRREYVHIVTKAVHGHARSQQRAIGPSEVGHPCERRLGYKLLDYDENTSVPNWKATVGTALHTWLEEAFSTDDQQWGRAGADRRWILEQKLFCGMYDGQALTGSCDLYDVTTCTVVDHKTVGPTQLKKYKAGGPGAQYRAQAHIYGRGWQMRGEVVERVAIMFLPRNGELSEAYYWSEPYDEQVALAAIERLDRISKTTKALGDTALTVLPTADAFCSYCPYYKARSTDLTAGCPGDAGANVNTIPDSSAPAFGHLK